MTAFSRISPIHFTASYQLVALRRTRDLPLLRKRTRVFCLEEATGRHLREKGVDSAALLAHPLVKDYIRGFPEPRHLYIYQNYPELASLASEEGWRLLANPPTCRIEMARRSFFEAMVERLGLPQIPGGIHPLNALLERDYGSWSRDLGEGFVVQLPEILQGGGRGTFFIQTPSRYRWLLQTLKGGVWRGVPLKNVFIRRFIRGVPASVAVCVTRQGTLVSGPQVQLIDPPYCEKIVENGVFYGHVWHPSPSWPPSAGQEAKCQAARIGDDAARLGYRGLLGVDFVLDEGGQRVYPVEINPRFTGVFPMLSLLHMRSGLIPLEAFHILEFMGVPYRIDREEINRGFTRALQGGHVILFSCRGKKRRTKAFLDAGLYRWEADQGQGVRIGDGIDYADMGDEDQFVVIDGPPHPGESGEPESDTLERHCRILFQIPPASSRGLLTEQAARIVEWVYGRLELG